MNVDKLIERIDIRAQYKAYGLGELPLTDDALKTKLTNHLNTAIADLVQNINIDGAEFNVKVVNGTITVSLSVDGSSVNNIEAVKAAVKEYLENEVVYLWWLEIEPRFANGSNRFLLKDIVKKRILAFVKETIPPKRQMVPRIVNDTHIEYDYE